MDGTLSTSDDAKPFSGRLAAPFVAIVLASVIVAAGSAVAVRSFAGHGPPRQDAGAASAFQEATGLRVTLVAVTAGGGLIDFRYQAIDPEKAAVVHVSTPFLIDEGTGEVIDGLFMGHSHGGPVKAGYTYPLLFVNDGGAIERGDTVTVVIGRARLEHVGVS